jgi:hypothetical protein
VSTRIVKMFLSPKEIDIVEKVTGLKGQEAFEEFISALAEEFVTLDENTVKEYIRRLSKKSGEE